MEHPDASYAENDVDVPSNLVVLKPKIFYNFERKDLSLDNKK